MSAPPGSSSAASSSRYVIITVVRDEEVYLPRTLASMEGQTIPPVAWFIVDDGSQDRTPSLLAEAAGRSPWIRVRTQERRRHRNPSEATARGFNLVLPEALALEPFAIGKLDGDMEFEPRYYGTLLSALAEDPELGIVGARAIEPHHDGSWGLVRIPPNHVHGATLFFRREVLEQQGGLTVGVGEDTVPLVRARLAGWRTKSLPDLEFRHLRVTGLAGGLLLGQRNKGLAAYRVGYHPFIACLRGVRNMVRKPYVLSGIAFLRGFFSGYRGHASRALEPAEIRAFRRMQFRSLFGGWGWWR